METPKADSADGKFPSAVSGRLAEQTPDNGLPSNYLSAPTRQIYTKKTNGKL